MPTVAFTQNLRRHVNVERCEVLGETVGAALDAVFSEHPKLRSYLLDDRGAVRKHVAVIVNGETIADRENLSDPLKPDDEVFVMQALSGG
ncbi:MAG: molybdopterin synthase sulfur carrier subunit [Verrucomicrobiales bacterium]|jgi:molybdopterin synthase sulfur carrier subunit